MMPGRPGRSWNSASARGTEKRLWEEALSDYPDQTEHIMKFLRSRITDPEDPKQVKRAVDAALRRGHSYGEVRRGLDRIGAGDEEFLEEY